jgi:pimeloyl-ACP methyl ester carboxylesterase
MAFVDTQDGVKLFYNDWGSGPVVILIHGWPLNGDMWEYQARVLAGQGFRVIAYDRRGFGKSDQPWSGYDYDTLADDLHALITKLDLHSVSLVGFSMGGGEVARYLGRHGSTRVAKACLISAVTPFLLQSDDNPDGIDQSVFDGMVASLEKDRPAFLAPFAKTFFGAGLLNFSVSSELLQASLVQAMMASPKATIDCVRAFSQTDFRQDMHAFTVPTLIIHGTSDATVPLAASGQRAHGMVPTAKFLAYDGEPHGLHFTAKDRLNQDLFDFLRT